jgi:hypothetical protein
LREDGGIRNATTAGELGGLRQSGRIGRDTQAEVIQNSSVIRKRLAKDLIAREADDQVPPLFADADAGRVDESCAVGVAVLNLHLCTLSWSLMVVGRNPVCAIGGTG